MKVCCIEKGLNTCADCDNYSTCEVIQGFYGKKSYKYKKYEEAALYIREKGYSIMLYFNTSRVALPRSRPRYGRRQ